MKFGAPSSKKGMWWESVGLAFQFLNFKRVKGLGNAGRAVLLEFRHQNASIGHLFFSFALLEIDILILKGGWDGRG